MTGDGLQDIVLVHDGNVEYWPNLGHGDWGQRVTHAQQPALPLRLRSAAHPARRRGRRRARRPRLRRRHARSLLWINQSGNGWSEPIVIDGTPPVTDIDAVRLVDLLGTGSPACCGAATRTAAGRPHMFFLDLTGGVKPYLLNEMDNHMGAVTRVEYAPSTRFYLADEQRPATRAGRRRCRFRCRSWRASRSSTKSRGGKLTTEYRYHHGYWDGAEREFRGFGRVDQLDTETFEDVPRTGPAPGAAVRASRLRIFSPPTRPGPGSTGTDRGGVRRVGTADYRHEYWPGDAWADPSRPTASNGARVRRAARTRPSKPREARCGPGVARPRPPVSCMRWTAILGEDRPTRSPSDAA